MLQIAGRVLSWDEQHDSYVVSRSYRGGVSFGNLDRDRRAQSVRRSHGKTDDAPVVAYAAPIGSVARSAGMTSRIGARSRSPIGSSPGST